MEAKITFEERIRGGVYGLLIGDALGVPYEFHSAQDLPFSAEIEFDPPDYFRRSHAGVPPGTWSDDGAQALILLNSLLECGSLDLEHFANGLVDWYDRGFMTPDGIVFDVGIQTAASIKELKTGIAPSFSGGFDVYSNGNGSLMRTLPLALWHPGSDEELVWDAFRQSGVTHGHPRSRICCGIYCLWARYIIQCSPDPWNEAIRVFYDLFSEDSDERLEFESNVLPPNAEFDIRGNGYVVNSLRAAKWASDFPSYEQAVKAAISLGEDTDTTACITGGIVGLKYGVASIPVRWLEGLRGKGMVAPLADKLVARDPSYPQ